MNQSLLRRLRTTLLVDCLLIFLLAGILVKPVFKAKYLHRWASIESTFVSDARFLKDHWPHPRWQPLWYLGTRFDYIYPPALRYGTAALSRIWLPVKAYHFYTGLFYCFGIAGVYLFVHLLQGSRGAAWLAAACTALLSPSFPFLQSIRQDADFWTPQRLWVLLRYGEGPHMTALAVLPVALAFTFFGLHPRRPAFLALAALSSAFLVSNNFYGATALAIFFPLLVWSVWLTRLDAAVWRRAVTIVLLAYGLTAFWLTPSYLHITTFNLQFVADQGKPWCAVVTLLVMATFLVVSYRKARGKPAAAYLVFVLGSLLMLSLIVFGFFWLDFRVVGNAARLVPELDLAMTLAAVEGLRRLWNLRPDARVPIAGLVVASFATAGPFLSHHWEYYRGDQDVQDRVQYRMQDWMAHNLPDARTFTVGSVRFWYDTWHDLAQLSGGSDQGILNPIVQQAQWAIRMEEYAGLPTLWMRCLGVDAVIVSDKGSQEIYPDILHPRKFAGSLPVLYDDGAGSVIYRVPRRFPALARVIDLAQFAALPAHREIDIELLRAYERMVEEGPDTPVSVAWNGTDALEIHSRVAPGQAILLQESYDPYWRAYSAGTSLPVRKDPLGLMRIDVPPGEQLIRLVFELPLENRIGRLVSLLSAAVVLLLIGLDLRAR